MGETGAELCAEAGAECGSATVTDRCGDSRTLSCGTCSGSESWTPMASGTTEHLNEVWGASADDVWIAGDGGTLLHWDGTASSAVPSGVTVTLHDVMGADATHVWAVGEGGTVIFWNGSTWTRQSSGTTRFLSEMGVLSPTDLWAGGEDGLLLHRY